MTQPYPNENALNSLLDSRAEADMQTIIEIIHGVRSLKKEQNIQRQCPTVFIDCSSDERTTELLREHADDIAYVCKATGLEFAFDGITDCNYAFKTVSEKISIGMRLNELAAFSKTLS